MCTPLICVLCNSVMLNLFDAAICPLVFNLLNWDILAIEDAKYSTYPMPKPRLP